jgi:hypothetical protein
MSDDRTSSEDELVFVLRSGRRYTLAIRADGYVISGGEGPEETVATFDGDEAGHELAEREFRRLEREARDGAARWRLLRPAFLVALALWALSGVILGVWYLVTGLWTEFGPTFSPWVVAIQGVHMGSFVVWVAAIALLGFRWAWNALEAGKTPG